MWAGNLVKSAGRSVRVDYRIYYRAWVTVDYVRERWDVEHTDGVGALGWAPSHDTSDIRIWRGIHSERKGRSWCRQRRSLKFRSLVFKNYIKHESAVKDLCLSSSSQVPLHSVLKQGNGRPLVRKTDFIVYVISVKLKMKFIFLALPALLIWAWIKVAFLYHRWSKRDAAGCVGVVIWLLHILICNIL